MAQYDDVNSRSITLMGIYSALITLVVILGCQVLYFAMSQRAQEEKLMNNEYTASIAQLEKQRATLAKYGKEEREEGTTKKEYLMIPIDEAMKAVIKEQGQNNKNGQQPKTDA